MNASLLWRRPTCGVHTRSTLVSVVLHDPVDQECDGIFGFWLTAQFCCSTLRSTCSHLCRLEFWNHRFIDINVVGVEIIRDIAVFASPCFERLELAFWLTHVAVEVVEVTEIL